MSKTYLNTLSQPVIFIKQKIDLTWLAVALAEQGPRHPDFLLWAPQSPQAVKGKARQEFLGKAAWPALDSPLLCLEVGSQMAAQTPREKLAPGRAPPQPPALPRPGGEAPTGWVSRTMARTCSPTPQAGRLEGVPLLRASIPSPSATLPRLGCPPPWGQKHLPRVPALLPEAARLRNQEHLRRRQTRTG